MRKRMHKENGRLKPADPQETADLKGKTLECWGCGHTEVRRNIEFGAIIKCPVCNRGTLVEKVDI